jgi:hypothetical protein
MPHALQSGTSSSAASTDSKDFREGPVPLALRQQQQTKIITVQGGAAGNDDTINAERVNNANASIMDERAF